ncbi:hypothetical protein TELCIR_09041 [Teladorsagia circumcincta]|uniref:Amino acid permease/ SLC12A domain-containing protein n=1 Tax=Teladorsagia circumcincta TaxID=45464 RepID=A0A2G9UFX4_TELCI|nr:hypothetical protein TELCIR_09041 [Teladorsagia circumcincta]
MKFGKRFGFGQSSVRRRMFRAREDRKITFIECPPDLEFYRQSHDQAVIPKRRPTIQELAVNRLHSIILKTSLHSRVTKKEPEIKFGWIEGVFVRCLQNIIGVILYVRVTWVVAQAGLIMGIAMILLSSFVTTLTAISMSAICTNGEMKGGGLYYLVSKPYAFSGLNWQHFTRSCFTQISRTLGAEYGGSIGLIFSLANCVGGALHIVGFAETVNQLLLERDFKFFDGQVWDIRLISVVACTALMTVIVVSPKLESKLQQILLVPLLLSVLTFVIGSFLPTKNKVAHGYTGYQCCNRTPPNL